MRAAVLALLAVAVLTGAVILVRDEVRERDRLQRLTIERDVEAANSLRSFRAHERLQQVIPEYRPASKPAPGQRDA